MLRLSTADSDGNRIHHADSCIAVGRLTHYTSPPRAMNCEEEK